MVNLDGFVTLYDFTLNKEGLTVRILARFETVVWWFIDGYYSYCWGQYDRKVKDVERSLYEEGVFLQKGEEHQRYMAELALDELRARRRYYAKKLGLIRD